MKRLLNLFVLLVFSVLLLATANAQADPLVKEAITKTETKTFCLPTTYPDGRPKLAETLSMRLESKGTLSGIVNCQFDSDVIDFYKKFAIIINQIDNYNTTRWIKSGYPTGNEATVSYAVTDADIARGKEFTVGVRIAYHQGMCNCTLKVTFSEPVEVKPPESIQRKNIPVPDSPLPETRKKAIPTRKIP